MSEPPVPSRSTAEYALILIAIIVVAIILAAFFKEPVMHVMYQDQGYADQFTPLPAPAPTI